jgi:ferredoxin hydrogenase
VVTAIRSLGADFVLDVVAGADLTIMEEANELVERIKNKDEHKWPMFTSCCPAWVKYCETFFPELIPNLSSAKSPIAMQASIIKTYFAKNVGIDKSDLYVVAVAPCTAKKAERLRPELNASGAEHDCDCTITTVELAQMIKEKGLDFSKDDNGEFDSIFGYGSSSGLIFGNTGGVMQAALRTGFYMLTGRNMNEEELTMLDPIRTIDNLKIGEVDIDGIKLRVAAVSQMSEARKLIESIKNKEIELDFVEVMACRGGCANGGGQQKILRKPMMEEARVNRNKNLYSTDTKEQKLRFCHESPVIKELYDTYLEKPGSHLDHELLHTTSIDRSKDLGE